MKLRIRGNSVRLRLGQSEVTQLVKDGRVSESIQFSTFPRSQLSYAVVTSLAEKEITARLADYEIKVTVPERLAQEWANSWRVGLKHVQPLDSEVNLSILIEKDFRSLEPRPTKTSPAISRTLPRGNTATILKQLVSVPYV